MPLMGNKSNNKRAVQQQNMAATGMATGAMPTNAAASAPASNFAGPGHIAATSNLPGPAPHTSGPHRHDFMNKIDPTVDAGTGGMQVLASSTHSGATGMHGTAPMNNAPLPGQAVPHGGVGNPAYGVQQQPYQQQPVHKSHLANALDPRVDAAQTNPTNYAMAGAAGAGTAAAPPTNVREGTYGPHSTRMGNMLDPKVDSDADHRMPRAQANASSVPRSHANLQYPPGVAGPAPTTAGPHKRDWMNKLDPGVNSKPGAIGGTNALNANAGRGNDWRV